jgi:hypothetical protein
VEVVSFDFVSQIQIRQSDVPHPLHLPQFPRLFDQSYYSEKLNSVADPYNQVPDFLQWLVYCSSAHLQHNDCSHQNEQYQVELVMVLVDK